LKSALLLLLAIVSAVFVNCAHADGDSAVQFNRGESGGPIKLSTSGDTCINADVAMSGNNTYVAWCDNSAGSVLFRKSSDSGLTFGKPILIAASESDPLVAVSGSSVYVAFGSGVNVYVASSTDGGQTFGDPVNVSKTGGSFDLYLTDFDTVASGDNVYVIWQMWGAVTFAKSTDGGRTFASPIKVSGDQDTAKFTHLTVSGDNVYVTWYDYFAETDNLYMYHISYAWSNDGGSAFHSITNFSGNHEYFAFEPDLVASGNTMYFVWRDEGPGNSSCSACIVFLKSTDGGNKFAPKKYVADGGYPALALVGQKVYLTYAADNPNYENMFVIRSLDGGETFSDPVQISNQTWDLPRHDESGYPVIAATGDNVYVLWRYTNPEGNREVFFSASVDSGETFSTINLSDDEGETGQTKPAIAAKGDKVHVAWSEYGAQSRDIMYLGGTAPQSGTDEEPSSEEAVVSGSIFSPYLIIGLGAAAGIGAAAFVILRKRKTD